MKTIHLIHYSDAAHGWLKVPKTLLRSLDMHHSISQWSYQSKTGLTAYLEEDGDATLLLNKLKELGLNYIIKDVDHGDRSFIRSLPQYRAY